MTANEVATRLAAQAAAVAEYLLPKGKRDGKEWCVGSVAGEAGKSLKICLQGRKAGVWSDFASEHSGDLLDLWSKVSGISIRNAIREAKQWLGITTPMFLDIKPQEQVKLLTTSLAPLSASSKVASYLQEQRKLTWETCQQFQIQEKNDFIVLPYLVDNETLQIKQISIHRKDNKKKIFVERNAQQCLFGWQTIPSVAREITLTEGEIDAMTLTQYGIPALSLPFGGGNAAKHKWLEFEFERLSHFDKIYLCFDNDTVGQQTVQALLDRLGRHRCYVVTLPHKDANECLQQGVSTEEIQQYFLDAITHDPEELKCSSTFKSEVINLFYPDPSVPIGYTPPWEAATQHGLVFRKNELTTWTGINGHGKSLLLNFLMLHFMQQGANVCIASLELKPAHTLWRMVRQATACKQPEHELIDASHDWLADKLWLYNFVGSTDPDSLLSAFEYAYLRHGADNFVIDSFVKCNIAEDDLNAQQKFMSRLCDFKNKYPVHIHLVAHPRKLANEVTAPSKIDIRGSSAISDLADNCITIWRNKSKDKLLGDGMIRCDKQRHGDWEGQFNLWFDTETLHYLDYETSKPTPIIHKELHYE